MSRFIEPEGRELGKDLSLVRDAARQDNVERRDAVGGHDKQFVA